MLPKVLILALIASVLAFSQGADDAIKETDKVPEGPIQPILPKSTTSTTAVPTPTTNTTTPASTNITTTTTATTTTTSTTTTSNTTTEKPTTSTAAPTSTSTTAPTSTSTAEPTTTPAPITTAKPTPEPQIGKWNATNKVDNITCIIVEMAIQLNVTLPSKTNQTRFVLIDVPQTAMVDKNLSLCGNESQILHLYWDSAHDEPSSLVLNFTKNKTAPQHFALSHIEVVLSIMPDDFPEIKNATHLKLQSVHAEFETPMAMSYRCTKKQSINLMAFNSTHNNTLATLIMSHTQLQAFHDKTNANFNAAQDCEPSTSPDIVPIAVGCALVGLVAVVLIAYLIGRRRSQARGYLSM